MTQKILLLFCTLLLSSLATNCSPTKEFLPLMQAALDGNVARTQQLLAAPDAAHIINAKTPNTLCTPMHAAALKGHSLIIIVLANNHGDVDAQDSDGDTPLHIAALMGNKQVAQTLLAKNASKEIKNNAELIPARVAEICGHTEIAELLGNIS